MTLAYIFVELQRITDAWMARAGEADPVLGKKHLLVDAAAQPGHETDGQIGLTRFQGPLGIAVDARDFQANAGCVIAQVLENLRQQGDVAGVAQAQAKAPLCAGRVKTDLPGGQPAQ